MQILYPPLVATLAIEQSRLLEKEGCRRRLVCFLLDNTYQNPPTATQSNNGQILINAHQPSLPTQQSWSRDSFTNSLASSSWPYLAHMACSHSHSLTTLQYLPSAPWPSTTVWFPSPGEKAGQGTWWTRLTAQYACRTRLWCRYRQLGWCWTAVQPSPPPLCWWGEAGREPLVLRTSHHRASPHVHQGATEDDNKGHLHNGHFTTKLEPQS